MDFKTGLYKLITAFETEKMDYMIVGGFATSYYNQFRFTADIDAIIQIYPHQIKNIVKHFPNWKPYEQGFIENAQKGIVFNITDFESGVKFDFMVYKDSDYNWTAFQRRNEVEFYERKIYIASPEDLIISKLQWYNISESGKQMEDIEFLLTLEDLNMPYLVGWSNRLLINKHGLF
ncbi:MAG: DUF6036 family nucleotidyltransferase [Bacteroidota bacterium]